MPTRYYKNAGYRNICVIRLDGETEYVLAFQSNITDLWYYWRDETDLPLGLMQYQTNAERFDTRLQAIRSFRRCLKASNSSYGALQYQGAMREY